MSILLFLRAFPGSTLRFTSGQLPALPSWSLLIPLFLVLLLFNSRREVEEIKDLGVFIHPTTWKM